MAVGKNDRQPLPLHSFYWYVSILDQLSIYLRDIGVKSCKQGLVDGAEVQKACFPFVCFIVSVTVFRAPFAAFPQSWFHPLSLPDFFMKSSTCLLLSSFLNMVTVRRSLEETSSVFSFSILFVPFSSNCQWFR